MQAFLVIISLDHYLQKDEKKERPFNILVHKLLVEDTLAQSSKWSDVKTTDLPFEPTKIVLNFTESAFLLSGPKGVLVGDLPGTMINMINYKEQNLENPPTDVDIICHDIFEGRERLDVIQAEFTMLNKNNLLVLGKNEKGTVLQLINLHD